MSRRNRWGQITALYSWRSAVAFSSPDEHTSAFARNFNQAADVASKTRTLSVCLSWIQMGGPLS